MRNHLKSFGGWRVLLAIAFLFAALTASSAPVYGQDTQILATMYRVTAGEHQIPQPFGTNGSPIRIFYCGSAQCTDKREMAPGIEWYYDLNYTVVHINRMPAAGWLRVEFPPMSVPLPVNR